MEVSGKSHVPASSSQGNGQLHSLDRRLGRPQGGSGLYGVENNLALARNRKRTVQAASTLSYLGCPSLLYSILSIIHLHRSPTVTSADRYVTITKFLYSILNIWWESKLPYLAQRDLSSLQYRFQSSITKKKLNSVVWVRERTIPTGRPPLVGEVSAKYCG
jgi:hypothetical protein